MEEPPITTREQVWFMSSVVVGIARLYDALLLQITLDHGEQYAQELLKGHTQGQYLFPHAPVQDVESEDVDDTTNVTSDVSTDVPGDVPGESTPE